MKARSQGLPAGLRTELIAARYKHGWSQADLGQRVGLPQAHISGLETGRVAPRYDTLLDLVRVLDHDMILVPRELVPVIHALIRDHRNRHAAGRDVSEEQPLYALDDDEEESS